MAILSGIQSVIHRADEADFNNYVYTKLYCSANETVTLNDTPSVSLVAGVVLDMFVYGITSTSNVFLIGLQKSNMKVDPNLGSKSTN